MKHFDYSTFDETDSYYPKKEKFSKKHKSGNSKKTKNIKAENRKRKEFLNEIYSK